MQPSERAFKPGISGQRLTLPVELEDGRIPERISNLVNYICALLITALLWGTFAQIRERVVTIGEIIPSGHVLQIQHLEGGKVEQVVVSEGQIVDAGAALVHLRPTAAASDLNQLRVRTADLDMKRLALTALLEGRAPDFGEAAQSYPDLAVQQHQVFKSRQAQIIQERQALVARISQKKAEVTALILEAKSLERQKAIQQEQLDIRTNLLKDGYTSRRAYLTTKTAFEETTAKFFSTTGRLEVTREQLVEAKSTLQASDAEMRKTLSEERSTATTEWMELQEKITKQRDRVERMVVRSPIHGIVQELAQSASGEVVRPGDLVARIVPIDTKIVAEVRIDPDDIGHIKQGDYAEVKLSTFDPGVFGTANGIVDVLSATTFTDKEGNSYYKATISLDNDHVGSGNKKRTIRPGMAVEADIITGSKSMIKYMLAPVYRSLDRAFSER